MTVGIFTTAQITPDLAKKSFAAAFTRLFPNGQAPLFGLTSMLTSETAVQIEHGFFTKTMVFPQLTLAANMGAVDVVITVTNTNNVLPNMLMRVDSTGEQILVNTIMSPTQVSVQRAVGGVAAQAAVATVNLYQTGTAFEEGSYRPNALQINPIRVTNMTQIFRNTWAITGSVQSTQNIAGDTNVAENRMDCAGFHAVDIEKGLFWGQKSVSTRNGMPFRTMDGLYSIVSNLAYYPASYAQANITNFGATTNYTQFEAAFDPLFNQATDPKVANERVMFVGGIAKRIINNIGRLNGTYYMVDGQTSWGLQFATIKIARGTFRIIEHPLFNTNPSWGATAFGVDLSTFNLAYLGDRKTQNKDFNMNGEDAADNGIDAVGGTLTTELTTMVRNPPANGFANNFTAALSG